MVVNPHLSIHNRFYGFTSWSRTSTTSSIVPAFLRSTSCGMTSARGHGAIVYCLNSGSECCVKGILGTGGVMDKCVQMFDKELWRLGPDGSGEKKERSEEGVRERERTEGGGERNSGERDGRRREKRREEKTGETEKRKGLSPEIGVKKTMNAGGVENGNMN
ncbi:hypothetical protein TNCV_4069261 [Trichonephila clavipes]|nr:hypothetical protein TNCV_4069261 [Trichonephila clavipes]